MTTVAIHQPQYLPYLGFFHKVSQCDIFVALDDAQFSKNGVQNRNKIKDNQGWRWLTVPVLHHAGQLINEVQTNAQVPWQQKQWNAVVTNYTRAPYFDQYGLEFRSMLDQKWPSLCELNMAMCGWAMDKLKVRVPIIYASQLNAGGKQTDRLVNICRAVQADRYLSGPGGRRYMDISAFDRAGIEVIWQQFTSPVYEQVFPQVGFIPDLSVVDALLCCGPQTADLLHC